MTIYVYATNTTSGTVHLTHGRPQHRRTLCGRPTDDLRLGDETVGWYTTCGTCNRILAHNRIEDLKADDAT